jgi:hypothetical protein
MAIKTRILRYSIGLAAAVLAAGGFAAGQASATPGRHCTVSVETGAAQCFATFREAIAAATGGRVTDAPDGLKVDSKLVAELNTPASTATVPIGIEFLLTGWNGTSVTFTGAHPCTTTTADNEFSRGPLPTVAGVNWNNNIRSFQVLNNCWQTMLDNADCTGLLFGPSGGTSDLGPAANDRTECILWS